MPARRMRAAIDVATGELRRARFGAGSEEVVAWLAGLPQPGPGVSMRRARPGSGSIARRAAAGFEMRRDRAEQDAAGARRPDQDRPQGRRAAGPAAAGRAAEDGRGADPEVGGGAPSRAGCASRSARDLMRCRHRVSKLLLRARPRLSRQDDLEPRRTATGSPRQQFEQPATELAFLDLLAAVDGLTARKRRARRAALAARAGRAAGGRPSLVCAAFAASTR